MTATRTLGSRKMWLAGSALFALGVMPAAVSADHRHVSIGFGVGAVRAESWVPPVYETQARRVLVAAAYEERARRVWHDPVYAERRVAVQVPAEVIERRVPIYGSCGTVIGFRTVRDVVRPARTEWRTERVCVQEGYYETVVDRVCVRPEATRVAYDQVIVRPGHWTSPNRLEIHKDSDRHFSFALGWGD